MTQRPPPGGDDNSLPANGLEALPRGPGWKVYPSASGSIFEGAAFGIRVAPGTGLDCARTRPRATNVFGGAINTAQETGKAMKIMNLTKGFRRQHGPRPAAGYCASPPIL